MPQPIRIEMPMNFTFKSVNAYLFVEPEPVLVDCGLLLDSSRSALVAGLAAEGLELGDIRQIYLTHPHIDHMGQAADLAAETQAEIWVSDIAADLVANFGERGPAFTAFLDRLMTRFGFPHAAQTSVTEMTKMFWALRKDVPLNALHTFDFEAQLSFGGQEWQVIYAPGHMNRQVCFFAADSGQCLAADMLLPKAPAPVIEAALADPDERSRGLPDMLRSYDTFAALPIKDVYPGHGRPFRDHERLIDKQQTRIHQRKEQCLQLVQSGLNRIFDLGERMYSYLPAEGRMSGMGMLLGYLDLLEDEGRIRYRPVPNGLEIVGQ